MRKTKNRKRRNVPSLFPERRRNVKEEKKKIIGRRNFLSLLVRRKGVEEKNGWIKRCGVVRRNRSYGIKKKKRRKT